MDRSVRMTRTRLPLPLISLLLFTLSLACAPMAKQPVTITPEESQCKPGSAGILVGDGFLRTLCGCQLPTEAPGTVFPHSETLTCHLSSDIQIIFFYYLGTALRHQIIPTGNPWFVASPLSDPTQDHPTLVHTVKLSEPGTVYHFEDAFSGMKGEIYTP